MIPHLHPHAGDCEHACCLKIEHLSVRIGGEAILDDINLHMHCGQMVALIGPNGAGKSTVMGMISRLIAHDSGLVDFEGRDIGKWKSKELSKRLAILTQSNNIQMKLTVRELVTFDREHPGMTLRMVCHTPEALRVYQVDWNMFYQETKPHE